ncbi:MAG: HNH endonuclease [Anaerolineae bacterium]|nr:HNH endonuclease [Anaerolineae bacterium]
MSSPYISVALRQSLFDRANGRCEYCRTPESTSLAPHEIDHIVAQNMGVKPKPENLALSCTLCNKHKGSDLTSIDPTSGTITPLFHPRQHRWVDHFKLEEALIIPLTPEGRVTVRLLQLNRQDRLEERELLAVVGLLEL